MSSGSKAASRFGLVELESLAEQFAASHLDEYTAALETSGQSPQPKEVEGADK